MEPRGLFAAARPPEENESMVTRELEAAEALAGLARCSGELETPGRKLVKEPTDQAIAVQLSSGNTYTMVESDLNTEETVRLATSYQSNSSSKLRQNLTEAEKEARRLRRVLANRESARQTIRRRHAMNLELTSKAADLSEENENLKKEKELAAEECATLKSRNEFLKLQMANVKRAQMARLKKAEPRKMQKESKLSQAEKASSAIISPPVFLYNQPSLLSFIWPSVLPSPNAFELQHAFSSDVMSSSQFPMQHRDIPIFRREQEISSGMTGPGNPSFVLPVPWLLPFLSHKTTPHSHSDTNKRQIETSSAHQCGKSSSSHSVCRGKPSVIIKSKHEDRAFRLQKSSVCGKCYEAGFTCSADSRDHYTRHHPKTLVASETWKCVRPLECPRDSREDNIYNRNAASAPMHVTQSLQKSIQEPVICCHEGSVGAANKARRRRKELMKLKNIHCHHVRTHITND